MNILALDQSTNATGYAYFKAGKLVEFNTLNTSLDGNSIQRMASVADWFQKFVDENEVDFVAMEDTQLQLENKSGEKKTSSNPLVFQVLSKLLGIMEYKCTINNIDYKIVRSSEWKKTCGIKGRYREEQKENAAKFVKTAYAIEADQDTCDAICIGHHIINMKKQEETVWAF